MLEIGNSRPLDVEESASQYEKSVMTQPLGSTVYICSRIFLFSPLNNSFNLSFCNPLLSCINLPNRNLLVARDIDLRQVQQYRVVQLALHSLAHATLSPSNLSVSSWRPQPARRFWKRSNIFPELHSAPSRSKSKSSSHSSSPIPTPCLSNTPTEHSTMLSTLELN
jgi:hypothetical protein